MPQLNPAQLAAIKAWADEHGRNWKRDLSYAWADGRYGGFDAYGLLQQIRNQFGPSWLVAFSLPKEIAAHAETRI